MRESMGVTKPSGEVKVKVGLVPAVMRSRDFGQGRIMGLC